MEKVGKYFIVPEEDMVSVKKAAGVDVVKSGERETSTKKINAKLERKKKEPQPRKSKKLLPLKSRRKKTTKFPFPRDRDPIAVLKRELVRLNSRRRLSDYEKVEEYKSILSRFLSRKQNVIPVVKSTEVSYEASSRKSSNARAARILQDQTTFLEPLSATMKPKAKKLLDFILRTPQFLDEKIGWTEGGEFFYKGEREAKSHMTDLIRYAVLVKKPDQAPMGWRKFLEALREVNVPTRLYSTPADPISAPPLSTATPEKAGDSTLTASGNNSPLPWRARTQSTSDEDEDVDMLDTTVLESPSVERVESVPKNSDRGGLARARSVSWNVYNWHNDDPNTPQVKPAVFQYPSTTKK